MTTMQTVIESITLGAIEGITEFLPVSSTGHLIFFADLMKFDDHAGSIFEVVIQLGAILAICVLYFQKLWGVLLGLFGRDKAAWRFAIAVLVAFLPAAFLGVLLHDFIKEVLFSPAVVGVSLILGGIAIIGAEHFYKADPHTHAVEDFSPLLALKIGFAQCLAMIPGVSRSGATIIGALLMGVERKTAAEFSFFLAIPTMFGASAYDLYKGHAALDGDGITAIVIGFITAFIVAMLVVKWFVNFISTHGFVPFAWYRIAFGLVILSWLGFHNEL